MIQTKSSRHTVTTLDLHFLGLPGTIAAYLVPHPNGAVLVECGPGSTVENLKNALQLQGLKPNDITDVLVTHIHLDHAGSAGWWARQGARIHVHPVGAPHLSDPEKLLSSAKRIYGERMDELWGEFLPVPPEKLVIHEDNEPIEIEDLRFVSKDTPGHAFHHFVYLFEGICFTGDIGAVRIQNSTHLSLPMPPPEFHLELWRGSLDKLGEIYQTGGFVKIAPTHFGLFEDAGWHLQALKRELAEMEDWITSVMPANPSVEELKEKYLHRVEEISLHDGLTAAEIEAYEAANPSWMSAAGIYRYWHKVRNPA